MKKMMVLTLAILGMVLGSFAVVPQAIAQSQDCNVIDDPYGCAVVECGNCIYWSCIGQGDGHMEAYSQ